jgi:inorganic triphosphatase YgiF
MGTEIECKLAAPDPAVLTAIAQAYAPRGVCRTVQTETTYYDLGSLLARKWMLRSRRTDGGAPVYTFKCPGEGYARGEWECGAESPSAAVRALIALGAPAELASCGALPVLCGAAFTRTTAELTLRGAVVELALDQGVLTAPGAQAPVCEAELELKSGELPPMLALRDELIAQFGLTESFASKFSRALALTRAPQEDTP